MFRGIQAYTASYLSVSGGDGADTISVGAGKNDYVGSVWVDGDAGDDTITIGHIQGSTGGPGYVDGGDGQDRIHVIDSLGGIGIWGNWAFSLRGGAGADSFQVDGMVLNVLGKAEGVQLDGGDGFDVLHWSGNYNLTVGGRQNPALGLYSGYRQELKVANIEQVDLGVADVSGLTLAFSARDVAAITAGSDFDRAYVANEVAFHRTVNEALAGTLIPEADNPELKALLETGLALFQEHQKHAEHLAQDLR